MIEKITKSLSNVIDPELGINIIDLGLVYDIRIKKNRIEVDFTLTSPNCPLAELIENNIFFYLNKDFPGTKIRVFTVWTPLWSPERMNEEAKFSLGFPI